MKRAARHIVLTIIMGIVFLMGLSSATLASACPCSIWPLSAVPGTPAANEGGIVELGVKFRAESDGYIVALRFYKGLGNTGTHVGHLWANDGTLLSEAVYSNETATGWQQVALPAPVFVRANTTYVASYHTSMGHFALNLDYFGTAVGGPPVRALAAWEDAAGNGVYKYGPSGSFPTDTWRSSNYWVDVVFVESMVADTIPPTVSQVTPANGASGVAIGSNVTIRFSEAMNAGTLNPTTIELRDGGGNLVPAVVSYDPTLQTVTLDPNVLLAYTTAYTARVVGGPTGVKDLAGNPLANDYVFSFSTAAPLPSLPYSIWPLSVVPGMPAVNEAGVVELGVKFRTEVDGYIVALRFYKGLGNTGTHVGHLWTNDGTLLSEAVYSNETGTGWQQVALPAPVFVRANTTYVASYHTSMGHFALDLDYFGTAIGGVPVRALAAWEDAAGNGVYKYGPSGSFPTDSWRASNYWVDVVFVEGMAAETFPPTVSQVTPANGASGVAIGSNVTIRFSEAMNAGTLNPTTIELRDGGGNLVPAVVSYDPALQTVTLDPNVLLAYTTTYTARVVGGPTGVRDLAGNPLANDYVFSFSTAAPLPSLPYSIWPLSAVPGMPAVNEAGIVELGVKFRTESDGHIVALRFYKGLGNTGTHVGHLWANDGTLLSEAVYSNETATGWQQVALPAPVFVRANTTYVASYHTSMGHFALDLDYFGTAIGGVPVRALAAWEDAAGNGVYKYGPSGSFPTDSWRASNYWVDVVFVEGMAAETFPPTVSQVTPANGASGVAIASNVTIRFSEAMNAGTLNPTTIELRDGIGNLVPAAVSYDPALQTATLDPNALLTYLSAYAVRVVGGPSGVKDLAGNPLANDYVSSFSTAPPPPPPPDEGPGGPILVIADAGNPFGRYYTEILRNEGLNAFVATDISLVTPEILNRHTVVLLAELSRLLSPTQISMLTSWVTAGGNLIAMRPDRQLAPLLGLTYAGGTLPVAGQLYAYLLVDTSTQPGLGIVDQTIQYHGLADLYTLSGATSVATLYADAAMATVHPAVTLQSVGAAGGQAAAFTYDLARSVVYTRQGNPAWAGQNRYPNDPSASRVVASDMYYGDASYDPQPDWIDFDKIVIPQADEQQRLLVNLIQYMNGDKMPLPRFWYFPRGEKAVVIMTGDDHAGGGTAGRFDYYKAASPSDCSVENWECVRASAYIWSNPGLTDAQAAGYTNDGFEVGVHINTDCADWTPAMLTADFEDQLSAWYADYPSLPPQVSERTHCVTWSDWATHPKVMLTHGIRLDTNYYYYPADWVQERPGLFTGSGMPMRFADQDGRIIDVYQAVTQMTDESSLQGYGYFNTDHITTLLDNAIGPPGYYGAFTANMHNDVVYDSGSKAIIDAAEARGVPVVSGRQMVTWLDGRNSSTFGGLAWNGGSLSFQVNVAGGATGLQMMLPVTSSQGALTGLAHQGLPVPYGVEAIKGIEYAVFPAVTGSYTATYHSPAP